VAFYAIMLGKLKQNIEDFLGTLPYKTQQPSNLYVPMDYILGLKAKRVRPLLTLLAYHAVSRRNPLEAMRLGCAIELFHNFTLIHDDIMDNAPTRRGQATVHEKWDTNIAILSGDTMFAIAMGMVVQEFPEKAADLTQIFTQAAIEVCEGQMEDMDMMTRSDVSIKEYIEMIRKKTSVLLGASLKLGAIAGGAGTDIANEFYDWGIDIGIAFQLQDDLMDAFPTENFGKQVGGDIIENKKTFLHLMALEGASEEDKKILVSHYFPDKVAQVLEIYEKLEIRTQTESLIESYFRKADAIGKTLSEKTEFGYLWELLHALSNRIR
jgi:geranylgeranyl diphosphate synthase type II